MTDANGGVREPDIDPDTGGVRTPLFDLHTELGGRMVNFGGYALPMRYGDGTVAEHRATRTATGLFDVSHMGIIDVRPADGMGVAEAAAWLECSVPGSIVNLAPGRMRYTLFTTAAGGVLDDLIVSNLGDRLRLVVNAVRTDADLAALAARLDDRKVRIEQQSGLALVALQGPAAAGVLARWAPAAAELAFMSTATLSIDGVECEVSRCGYTGEDGFEVSIPASEATHVARLLLSADGVVPAGLGARDTLRLEAGLPLVGHELTEATTPGRGRTGLVDPQAPARRGRLPRCGDHHRAAA